MKKVLGTLAVAIVLVAAFPMTASAGNVKPGCGGIFFRPCPTTMPPVATGNPNGTRSGGGSGTTGTGTGTGSKSHTRTLPPAAMPPVGAANSPHTPFAPRTARRKSGGLVLGR